MGQAQRRAHLDLPVTERPLGDRERLLDGGEHNAIDVLGVAHVALERAHRMLTIAAVEVIEAIDERLLANHLCAVVGRERRERAGLGLHAHRGAVVGGGRADQAGRGAPGRRGDHGHVDGRGRARAVGHSDGGGRARRARSRLDDSSLELVGVGQQLVVALQASDLGLQAADLALELARLLSLWLQSRQLDLSMA